MTVPMMAIVKYLLTSDWVIAVVALVPNRLFAICDTSLLPVELFVELLAELAAKFQVERRIFWLKINLRKNMMKIRFLSTFRISVNMWLMMMNNWYHSLTYLSIIVRFLGVPKKPENIKQMNWILPIEQFDLN